MAAQQGDLTNLVAVKAWLNTSDQAWPPGDDDKLSRLITAASRFVQQELHRSLIPADYVEKRNGTGTPAMFLRNRPVLSVSALTIGTTSVAQAADPNSAGYLFDQEQVYLVPGFPCGFLNVQVSYAAGFQATASAVVPTNDDPLKVSDLQGTSQVDGLPAGSWNSDRGVSTVGGLTMLRVATDPQAGQYALKLATDGTWTYVFNPADGSTAVTVLYGYTPSDLEQVVIELVGERFKTRSRIGQTSVTIGNGQTTSFSTKDVNDWMRSALNNYVNVVPV